MVNKENIGLFITTFGCVAGEMDFEKSDDTRIHLNHPLRLVPGGEGQLMVAALFVKEEWAKLPLGSVVEISVDERIQTLYVDYEQKLFGSVIMPEEKRIII